MADAITVPAFDDDRVLRHVEIDGRYALLLWDTYRTRQYGGSYLGYSFGPKGGEPIFTGEDYGCAPGHAIDSDDAVRGLLGFLTLRIGDTDSEYFASYTEAQHAFASGDAEYLSLWATEPEDGEAPLPLVDIE